MKILTAKFKQVCQAEEDWFDTVVPRVQEGTNRPYWFKNNGSKILAVAHVDSVCSSSNHFGIIKDYGKDKDDVVLSPRLDDRAGVHIILNILPAMNITTDILLATDEERGTSTASLFKPPKDYNWVVEFDRKGDDYVLYHYDTNKLWLDALAKCFPNKGYGSASDISKMEGLGCSAVNIGVGYEDYHGEWAKLFVSKLVAQLERFKTFYSLNFNTFYKHEKKAPVTYNYGNVTSSSYGETKECPGCKRTVWVYKATNRCWKCQNEKTTQVIVAPKTGFYLCEECDEATGIEFVDITGETIIKCLGCLVGKTDEKSHEIPCALCTLAYEPELLLRTDKGEYMCEDCFMLEDSFTCAECHLKLSIDFLSLRSFIEPKCIYCLDEADADIPLEDVLFCDACEGNVDVTERSDGIRLCALCSSSGGYPYLYMM